MPILILAQAAAIAIAFPMVARQVLKGFVVVCFLLSLWLIPQAARAAQPTQSLFWDIPGDPNPTPNGLRSGL
jgi:hypothetical protein